MTRNIQFFFSLLILLKKQIRKIFSILVLSEFFMPVLHCWSITKPLLFLHKFLGRFLFCCLIFGWLVAWQNIVKIHHPSIVSSSMIQIFPPKIKIFGCLFWSWLAELCCQECSHSETGSRPNIRRNWSLWQSQILYICWFANPGSLWHFERLQRGRKVAKECSLPFPEPNCKQRYTSHYRWWRLDCLPRQLRLLLEWLGFRLTIPRPKANT